MLFFSRFFACFLLILTSPFSLKGEPFQEEKVVVIGGGVGALSSSIYLSRANLNPLVIVGDLPGGLLTQSTMVQNWPGELEIKGGALTDKIRLQAERNGARFLEEKVIRVDFSKRPFSIWTQALNGTKAIRKIEAESCIIAMGTEPNFLQIPGEKAYWGRGISNCAICDGSLYKGKKVGVVGGGDAAVLEAIYLSQIAGQVDVFVRKDRFKALEETRLRKLLSLENVHVFYETQVQKVLGDQDKITHVLLKKSGKKQEKVSLDALFLAIGSTPNSNLFKEHLKLDEKGYILLTKDQETSIPGVFAIGDIVDPVYKQAISAAGDGAKAALQAQKYLSEKVLKEPQIVKAKELVKAISLEITSIDQFYKEVELSDVPVVVDFYAPWCPPCKRISPLFESMAVENEGKARFFKVNVDEFPELLEKLGIQGMPTVIVFQEGKERTRKIGTVQIEDLFADLKLVFDQ